MTSLSTVQLQRGADRATVDLVGGRVASFRAGQVDVLAGREHPDQFAYRGSLLAPWPNRVTGGRWTWRGHELQLPRNDPTGVDAALHGLVVDARFSVQDRSSSAVSLVHHLEPTAGYPFALDVHAGYALTDDGLACTLRAVNVGVDDAPVGLGVHPYISAAGAVDDVELTLPAHTMLVTDDQWREVRRQPVQEAGLDFRNGLRLADRELDAAFTDVERDPSGRVEVVVARPDGQEVLIWSGSTCRWLLVYTGHTLPGEDHRRSIAIEPMTCPPNALATGEIDVLHATQSLQLDWGVTLR